MCVGGVSKLVFYVGGGVGIRSKKARYFKDHLSYENLHFDTCNAC